MNQAMRFRRGTNWGGVYFWLLLFVLALIVLGSSVFGCRRCSPPPAPCQCGESCECCPCKCPAGCPCDIVPPKVIEIPQPIVD